MMNISFALANILLFSSKYNGRFDFEKFKITTVVPFLGFLGVSMTGRNLFGKLFAPVKVK